MTNRLTEEEYKQMASEISGASVSVWDDTLEFCEDGIKLDDLWAILDKYLKAKEDEVYY
jgi:hypothetical protein